MLESDRDPGKLVRIRKKKFALHLDLSESYIYGTATIYGKDYPINIQQAAEQMIVLPPDFSYIGELDKALISFGRDNDNNDKKISVPSKIHIGQGDLIEIYLDQDDVLLSLANNLITCSTSCQLNNVIGYNHFGV